MMETGGGGKRTSTGPTHEEHGRRSTPGETTPSRVVHVRGLPAYTTESELLTLCTPFGTVIRVLLLQQQQQAFVQMASVEAASALLTRYTLAPATIRSKQVFFQYSNRTEIKAPMVGTNQQGHGHGHGHGGGGGGGGHTHQHQQHTTAPSSDFKGEHQSSANSILLVTVLNVRVPVTLDHLHTIFKPYGDVRKIIIFNKNNVFKALVQMGSVDSAVNAKLLLEGKDMFQGCCHLRIGFSSLQDLRVQQNGPRARDYTVSENFTGHSSNYNQPSYLFNQPNGYAPPTQHAPPHHHQQHASSTPYQGYASFPPNQQPPTHTTTSTNPSPTTSYSSSPTEKGCVVLVSNLPDHRITPDVLFTLFGVYGDVIRVKILFNKRDTAMIQFATAQQAYLATLHLNHLQVYDKEINVSPSKHTEVSLPRPSELEHTDAGLLTKDYTNSPIHRFKKRSSTDAKNIHPPSQVLHVSNLYDGANENELRGLFGAEQKSAPAVQFFSTSRKQAFIRMESLHDAIMALIRLHNYKLGDRYMRVSFSHKEPSMVKDSDGIDGDGSGDDGTGDGMTGTDLQHSNEGEQQETPQ